MKRTDCISEQDLLLIHYGDGDGDVYQLHLNGCAACRQRLEALRTDLARLPRLQPDIDDYAATRMAARLTEQLNSRKRHSWLPAAGAATVALAALVMTLTWLPSQLSQPQPVNHLAAAPATDLMYEEDMPDIEFLEDLELLRDLDTLRQIEGV
jgi:hypothetical protein